jgi:hypothetical protein
MKAKTLAFLVVALLLVVITLPVSAGNGAPSGPHYNLNIIGVPKDKNPNIGCGNGHRIFVGLGKKSGEAATTRIMLNEGEFAVLDCDGTEDGEATFQLPDPDPENDGITAYSVYFRALGQPGGSGWLGSCLIDDGGAEYCSATPYILELSAHGNNNKFVNASKELLYVWVDLEGTGKVERYPLFADELYDYFWEYDNNGLKLVQLRFYPYEETNINNGSLTN